jgi:hypothetical protein
MFIDQETTNALVTFNDDITDRRYTPSQRASAVQIARESYRRYVPMPGSLAGDFRAGTGYLKAYFLPPPT